MAIATFAAGCFWGVEAQFRGVPGVEDVEAGYTGGHTEEPTYEQVCSHRTGHAEAVRVRYDPARVSYERLLEWFFAIHDPTQLDRQGPDRGPQYRSAVFYHDAEQERLARAYIEWLEHSGVYRRPIVTQVEPASPFWRAEEYHQRYFEKRGRVACHAPEESTTA